MITESTKALVQSVAFSETEWLACAKLFSTNSSTTTDKKSSISKASILISFLKFFYDVLLISADSADFVRTSDVLAL